MLFKLLGESEHNKRRTLADALEVLRTCADFVVGDIAKIWLSGLELPSRQVVHLVDVRFESTRHRMTFRVSLPSANRVRARFDQGQLVEFDISRLDGAIADGQGSVRLSDGAVIRSVEIIPALLPYNITALDCAILRQTILELGIEEECRYDPGDLDSERLEIALLYKAVDCSKLGGHIAPLLKTVQARMQDNEPEFGTVSQQKIADTLNKFGMRIPANRKPSRAKPSHDD